MLTYLLQVAINGKLSGGEGTDHEETGTDTRVRATDTELLADLDQTRDSSLTGKTLGLVDLGKHGVGGLRDNGGSETGHQTRAKVGNSLHTIGHVLLGELLEDSLRDLLEDDELGHGVRDPRTRCQFTSASIERKEQRGNSLLEQNGTETSVESTEALVLDNLAEARDETAGVGRLRDETDTGGLERAQGDIGEELGSGGRGQVDSSSVLRSSLVAEGINPLLLEELVSSELQGTLEEVTSEGRTDTSEESGSTLILDDLAEATDKTTVRRGDWNIHIDGGKTTVGDGTADSTGKGESGVESETRLLLGSLSLDALDDGVDLGGSCRGSHCE
ncbi:hypothetical protein HG530_011299 [Fusarium avenaceum]|nr:hypothetical protein HG530_011299 [Fusarium avenaceum]